MPQDQDRILAEDTSLSDSSGKARSRRHRLRILRLEDFESTNGPDLFVYLTVAGADDDDAALDAEFVDLGSLTGYVGDQNYVIPGDVDLDRYDSVVIWCRRFTTSFGVADLPS